MENQTNKLLPYQLLLRKNNIQETDLPRGTQQVIADIKKIRNILYAQSQRKGAKFEVSESTQEKINTYDRHICNDIFEYLDELEEKQEAQKEEVQKQENSSSESHSQTTNSQTTKQVTNEPESNDSEKSGRVGFWNWE